MFGPSGKWSGSFFYFDEGGENSIFPMFIYRVRLSPHPF